MGLKKAGANWVEGDRFFDREAELEVLTERVRDGTHTLLTAQRRMGKTSLVRELLRRLAAEGRFETIFVDLEDVGTPADAIAEIAARSRSVRSAWSRIKSPFINALRGFSRVEEVSLAPLRLKLRGGIDDGNWRQKGDEVLAALATNERPVVVAIDELPVFLDQVLRGSDGRITPEKGRRVSQFMSWLRKIGQAHNDQVRLILTGSISLDPILRQAGVSAHVINIFSSLDLKPWDEETALACLAALAETSDIDLPLAVRRDMCRRLGRLVPHDVQRFFECVEVRLRRLRRRKASLEDVEGADRRLLSRSLRGGELRGLLRRGVLAGVPVPPVGPGASLRRKAATSARGTARAAPPRARWGRPTARAAWSTRCTTPPTPPVSAPSPRPGS